MLNNIVTFKSRLGATQGHWKQHHLIDRIQVPISTQTARVPKLLDSGKTLRRNSTHYRQMTDSQNCDDISSVRLKMSYSTLQLTQLFFIHSAPSVCKTFLDNFPYIPQTF